MLRQTWYKVNNASVLRFSWFWNYCHFYVSRASGKNDHARHCGGPFFAIRFSPMFFVIYLFLLWRIKPQLKAKTMKIKIEKPCHEDWSKMTSEAQGKFCNACEKSVVDFSMMSDAQILNYFSQPKIQKVCGRFNADQVDRALVNMIPERLSPTPQLLHFAYLLIVVLGVGLSSCSNTVTGMSEITEQQDSTSPKMGKPLVKMGETVIGKVSAPASSTAPEIAMGKPRIMMGDTIMSYPVKKDSTPCRPNPILPLKVNPAAPKTVPPSEKTYIKGKVKITKPPVITVDPMIEDHKIMGECVIPE